MPVEVVTLAYSAHNNLLFVEGPPSGPAPPPLPAIPTVVAGSLTPDTIIFDNTQRKAYTVTLTSARALRSLTAYVRSPGNSYDFLSFSNISGDGVTWVETSTIYDFQTEGVWTVGDYDALWVDDAGSWQYRTLDGAHPTLLVQAKAVILPPTVPPTLPLTVPPKVPPEQCRRQRSR